MWDQGYTTSVDYLSSYHIELNPLRVDLSLLYAGILPPKIDFACELGFGQGININISSSTSNIKWYGNDFNPTQAHHASLLNSIANGNAKLTDESFEEFCKDETLPDFDFIALHGIWTWISDENRKIICEFIRRKLKLGGVLYISYNTSPGWAGMDHLRQLMLDYFYNATPSMAKTDDKIKATLDFFTKVKDTDPLFFSKNPTLLERLKKFNELDTRYLAHELFNKDWKPMSIIELSEYLTETKVSYATSAHYLDAIDVLNFSEEQAAVLNTLSAGIRLEAFKDIMVNQTFRRDLWVKGPIRLSEDEKFNLFLDKWVIMICDIDQINFKVSGVRGEADLQREIYEPIVNQFNKAGPVQLKDAFSNLSNTHNLKQFCEAIIILIGNKHFAPANDPKISKNFETKARDINNFFITKARNSEGYQNLCSPVTSSGISVHRVDQLFSQYVKNGKNSHTDLAKSVFELLKSKGQTLLQDGKPVENEIDTLVELEARARKFLESSLPLYKRLKIF